MRGREVIFHTALCLWDGRQAGGTAQVCNVQTLVRFRALEDAELDAYLRIEQPYDCAGSAKNEGLGIAILESIRSDDPTALTGLPLIALTGMLRQAGVRSSGRRTPAISNCGADSPRPGCAATRLRAGPHP
jgi:septum formation protein